eukprot:COSAG06_NODE_35084_length_464_cov_17.471233_1_plen_20_part_01
MMMRSLAVCALFAAAHGHAG